MPVSAECAAALLSFRYTSYNNRKWLALLKEPSHETLVVQSYICYHSDRVIML